MSKEKPVRSYVYFVGDEAMRCDEYEWGHVNERVGKAIVKLEKKMNLYLTKIRMPAISLVIGLLFYGCHLQEESIIRSDKDCIVRRGSVITGYCYDKRQECKEQAKLE